ncbi:type VI secretion protein [Streptomyces sp. NPDC127112]|uniref:type VI secretion protein n=1 Tax=Streptomyces sp. NPDC127112 TaxID=3345364 RepID=UPI00363E7470
MHDARGTEPRPRGGGIPDGALVGLLAFLLGLAVLVWSATGLAALFAKGAWPSTVTFTRTPGAVRALIAQPHDIPAAWPDTDPSALSGWGLFWGLFISQLLVLLVLTIFTLGVITRTKARRTRTKTPPGATGPASIPGSGSASGTSPGPGTGMSTGTGTAPGMGAGTGPTSGTRPTPGPDRDTTTPGLGMASVTGTGRASGTSPDRDTAKLPGARPAAGQDAGPVPGTATGPDSHSAAAAHPTPVPPRDAVPVPGPPTGPTPSADPHTYHGGSGRGAATGSGAGDDTAPGRGLTPVPGTALSPARGPEPTPSAAHAPFTAPAPAPAPAPVRPQTRDTRPPAQEAYRYGFGYAPPARTHTPPPAHRVAYAPAAERHHLAVQAVSAAEGAVLVVTSSPTLWQDTKDARAKLGPVLLYDPSHLCDTPARMHWNPADGCADRDTAAARAIALLAPVRPQARLDAAVADTAETLLRSWLQAAALDGLPFKQLARWAQGNGSQEPVRILRTHPQAAPGAAGELESALIAHPERREQAQYLTARALSCLTSVHIREACNPNRTDALTLASFAAEGGTLYVVGEPLEDPRTRPGAMPLLTALASHVVEHGRRMAARSSHGRLDPPMTLVLEDVAAVAPVPQLPDLLTDEKVPLLALCRSREQARARWPEWPVS